MASNLSISKKKNLSPTNPTIKKKPNKHTPLPTPGLQTSRHKKRRNNTTKRSPKPKQPKEKKTVVRNRSREEGEGALLRGKSLS